MLTPSYGGTGWPGEGSGEERPPIWRRLARWLPPLLLALLSAGSYACLLVLVLLPTVEVVSIFGDEFVVCEADETAGVSRQLRFCVRHHFALPVTPSFGWAVLIGFHIVCVLAISSWVKTARLAPGAIPLWLCSREPGDQAYFHNVLQAVEKKSDGSLRFCSKCGAFKPDRTHHCEQLGQCVLVLQHWSLWCNNAVGFYNYKCYLLALLYTAAAHAAAAGMLLPTVIRNVLDAYVPGELPPALEAIVLGGEDSVQAWALLSGGLSALLGAGALLWLLCHLAMAARGVTAAEAWRQNGCSRRKRPKPPLAGRPFDFSARANLGKVFGRHPILWLLPTNQGIEGNGIFFELSGNDAAADSLASRW